MGDPLFETPEFLTEKGHLVPLNLRSKTGQENSVYQGRGWEWKYKQMF